MKTAIIILLALCLGISLWINQKDLKSRNRQAFDAIAPEVQTGSTPPPAISGGLPKAPATIDFSGTAFEDNSWKLDNKTPGTSMAPQGFPAATLNDADFKLELPPALLGQEPQETNPLTTKPKFNSLLTNPGSN